MLKNALAFSTLLSSQETNAHHPTRFRRRSGATSLTYQSQYLMSNFILTNHRRVRTLSTWDSGVCDPLSTAERLTEVRDLNLGPFRLA